MAGQPSHEGSVGALALRSSQSEVGASFFKVRFLQIKRILSWYFILWGGSSARIERPPVTRKVAGSSPVHPASLRQRRRRRGNFFRSSSMKIAIIGCPGSGKSTLAFKLHQILHIPLVHLDQYFWKPGWQRPDRQEFAEIHDKLCDAPEWIMEGMATRHFEYRLQKADVIIFLDVPLYVCLYRIFRRAFANFGKVFFSSARGCKERLPDREFLTYVWNFNKKQKPEVKALLQKYGNDKKIFVVKNQHELNELIRNIGNDNA
jgi:adenylate kinase family enzyme